MHALLMQESEEMRPAAEQQWQELQVELCNLLQRGAQLAYLDGALDSDVRSRFFMSGQSAVARTRCREIRG